MLTPCYDFDMRTWTQVYVGRASLYAASTATCVASLATGCHADPLDTGPAHARVECAVVYATDPAVSTRSGANVPAGGVVTTDAAALNPATRPTDAAATQPTDDRVVFAAPTSRASYTASSDAYTSDGVQQRPYDNGDSRNTDYANGYANGYSNGYATNQYDSPNDYWFDRGYWYGSPYYYNNTVTSGYGYNYPYNYYGGRTYVYRNYGDRYDRRYNDPTWNDRGQNRDRIDRTPRVPYPYTDRDRDGNGVDDARDNGLNRPTRDANQMYRDRQARQNAERNRADDPRNDDARNAEVRRSADQREQTQSETNARRDENRKSAAEQSRPRGDDNRGTPRAPNPIPAGADARDSRPNPAADAPRRGDPPARADAPSRADTPTRSDAPSRNDAPRQAAPPAASADRGGGNSPARSGPNAGGARGASSGGGGGGRGAGGTERRSLRSNDDARPRCGRASSSSSNTNPKSCRSRCRPARAARPSAAYFFIVGGLGSVSVMPTLMLAGLSPICALFAS